MPEEPFSNEVALRIGLAARRLGGISFGDLIETIQLTLGEKIDEEGLSRLTVAQLKAAFGGSEGDEESERDREGEDAAFKDAVRILRGGVGGPALPEIEADVPAETAGSVRVAFASNTGEDLNGHFDSCERFLIYRVAATELKLVELRETAGDKVSDDRNLFRLRLIEDCKILYVVHARGSAAAKVIGADIHLISVPEGGNARAILEQLQRVIAGTPPPWLAKTLGHPPRELVSSYGA